ncbi:tape measure protein [Pseudomonas proteolytica]|uniref:tape measure protein n=1 Tax=Pseudomonas proteolytica TaxID=219574 RepID=UPI0016478B44|nr:tape measure protein [Pseudomonas proteolytica]MBC3339295.1 tape measure protein [Pseudomonas proteolytica]
MSGQTLRSLVVSVSAETSAYQREMARAGRMGQSYLRTITNGNREAVSSWRSQEAAVAAQERALGSLTGAVGGYARAMAGALAVGSLIHMADEWGQISSRLKIATGSQNEFTEAQTRLMDIGKVTYKSYAENAELFIRITGVLKDYGGTANDALNVTEALSLGLAVSGTKGQATAAVIDQVSKSLEGGKLQGDGFNAVVTQAPRLLQALQDSLGKNRDELRKMSTDGKLTIDVVAKAWISQVGKMRKETEGMTTSVADAGIRMKDALLEYVGTVDDGVQVTTKLAAAINFAADNLSTLASVAAAGGIALIAKRGAEATRTLVVSTREAVSASVGRAAAQVDAAAASLRMAQADVIAASRQVAFATTTAEATVAQRALTAAKIADLEASRALAVAQRSQAAAGSLIGRSASGVMGLLGGPVGLAALAAGTAASFWLFRDGAAAANSAAVDLKRPISDLRKEWEGLGNAQRRPILDKLIQEQAEAKKKAAELVKEMQAVAQGPSGDYMGGQRFTANQYQRTTASGNFRRGIAGGVDIDQSTQNLVKNTGANKEVQGTLEGLAAQYQANIQKVGILGDQIGALNGVMVDAKGAAEGVSAGLQSIKPPSAELVTAWEKRIASLTEKGAKLKDATSLGEVNRQGAIDNLDQTPEGKAILAKAQAAAKQADAEEKAKKSREESARVAKQASDKAKQDAKQLEDSYGRTLRALNEQTEVHGRKTELAKIEFETTKGTLSKLDAAKKVELERAAIALDHLNTQKSFKDLMSDVQKSEDTLLVTTRKRYEELTKLKSQGGLTADQYKSGADSISKASFDKEKAPKFTGLDSSVGGPAGELIKVAEADKELAKWREKELKRQKELFDEKLISEQQYLDRKYEINDENNKKLEALQDAYKLGSIAVFADLTGNAADMMKQMAGEGSTAYKVLFLASKAAAIAQAMVSTEVAATKALELGPIMGIPAAGLIRGLGYASVGMIAATAVAGFSEGGYTGPGGKYEPKGVVHGGEVVIRKEVVDQPGMKDYLIGLNRSGKPGYASGGFVGSPGISPAFTAPSVAAGAGSGAAPEIHLHINGDGSGGAVNAPEGYEQMGLALLATARSEMPKIARQVIQQEKGQNGLLDPNNRRNS